MEVNKMIQQVADQLDLLYLRATDYDANVRIEDIDLKSLPILIYNNLLEVDYSLEATTRALYPIEIKILKLGYFDATTEDADYIINRCRDIAQDVAKLLLQNDVVAPEGFRIDALNTVEIYDEIMTGVTLFIDIEFTINC